MDRHCSFKSIIYIKAMWIDNKPVKGRGAAIQPSNRYLKNAYGTWDSAGVDALLNEDGEQEIDDPPTKFIVGHAKSILNKVTSKDIGIEWSVNPYQGCEHGCAYCYARPTHEYWGYSAGLDFERTIIVKRNAADLLDKALRSPTWDVGTISISGNTDCYQPAERKEGITRKILQVAQNFGQPIGVITKNALVLRDNDIIAEMASRKLASVAISLTTQDEALRRVLEPRTSTAQTRLRTIETLSKAGVPVLAMLAPIIPSMNDHEIPDLLRSAANAGARTASYTVVRTNGPVEDVFRKWLEDHFPDRAAKVIAQISELHGGGMKDSSMGRRMRGEGALAESIRSVFNLMRKRYFGDLRMPDHDRSQFKIPANGQLDLFS
ncbi:MAG TPA: PA0069 family radical SAM protein [Flavobacteriales bacterium]|nr:PA0069 family radical SAM protein [Flavobacteriales bacterium]HQX37602.1 PA0069 family radical SAM protein [Flavobacteriales bacterium]HQZ92063.1 PA0069 family radical SAM protein [Flavobacteriales bacterium]